MTNSIESLETYDNLKVSKMDHRQKIINSFTEKLGIGITQQLDGKKDNNIGQRDIHLKEAARDFEKILVTYMIRDMWKTIPGDEDSEMPGAGIYLEMIHSALASEMVKGEGLGIAKMLYHQMKNKMKQDDNIIKPTKGDMP